MSEKQTDKPFLELIAERKAKWSKCVQEMSDLWTEKRWGEEYP